jgi:hypothetical protein
MSSFKRAMALVNGFFKNVVEYLEYMSHFASFLFPLQSC